MPFVTLGLDRTKEKMKIFVPILRRCTLLNRVTPGVTRHSDLKKRPRSIIGKSTEVPSSFDYMESFLRPT